MDPEDANVLIAAERYEFHLTRYNFCEEILRDCSNEDHRYLRAELEQAHRNLLKAIREGAGRGLGDFDSYR